MDSFESGLGRQPFKWGIHLRQRPMVESDKGLSWGMGEVKFEQKGD